MLSLTFLYAYHLQFTTGEWNSLLYSCDWNTYLVYKTAASKSHSPEVNGTETDVQHQTLSSWSRNGAEKRMGRSNPKGGKMQLPKLAFSQHCYTHISWLAKINIRVFLTTSSKDYSFGFHLKITIKQPKKKTTISQRMMRIF